MQDGYLYSMPLTTELILFLTAPVHHDKLALEGRVVGTRAIASGAQG